MGLIHGSCCDLGEVVGCADVDKFCNRFFGKKSEFDVSMVLDSVLINNKMFSEVIIGKE